MTLSRAVKTSLLVLLAGTVKVTEARFNQITIRDDGVLFRVRRFIADVTHLYRLVMVTPSDTSSFFIRSNGRSTFFKAGSENYNLAYDQETGDILELTRNDNAGRELFAEDFDEDIGQRRLQFACEDCEEAWDVVCDITLPIICQLVGNEALGTVGAQAVDTACTQFGGLCDSLSAAEACDGSCVEDGIPTPTPTTVPPVSGPGPTPVPEPEPTPEPTPAPTDPTPEPTTPSPVESPTPSTPEPSTPSPVESPTPSTPEPTTSSPVESPTPSTPEPSTSSPVESPTPSTPEPSTPSPVESPTPSTPEPSTPSPVESPTPSPTEPPTPSPVESPTPSPTPSPTGVGGADPCDPNPCENDGVCNVDPGGGHICDCASGFGGMSCQTDTSTLSNFYIEFEFEGESAPELEAIFQSAADRWAEVITDVPCGGAINYPPGRLLITATITDIDGPGGVLGSAGPTRAWMACPTISATGAMTLDIDDFTATEDEGLLEDIILHEMGHTIGIGTVWGDCSTCNADDSAEWLCPAVIEVYNDLLGNPGGTEASIVETDGGSGTACGHFEEDIFGDELMTGFISGATILSKVTAASLEDIAYTVDPSVVDPYTLPPFQASAVSGSDEGIHMQETMVNSTVDILGDDGEVVDQVDGIMIFF